MILINNKTKFTKAKGSNSTPATTDNVKVGTLITFAYSYNSRMVHTREFTMRPRVHSP